MSFEVLKRLATAVLLVISASTANALTYTFTARIDSMPTIGNGSGPIDFSGLSIGDTITGQIVYDPNAISTGGGSFFARYDGVKLSAALPSGAFSIDQNTPGYNTSVGGVQTSIYPTDHFVEFQPRAIVGPSGSQTFTGFNIQFRDSTASVLSGLALPTSLNLADYTSNFFYIYGDQQTSGTTNGAQIRGTVTSLSLVAPVPLPATAWLLLGAVGGFAAFSRRSKRARA